MTETIYGDVLFVINFSMDFLSLFITEKIMHIKAKPWRMLLSASIGGVYGVAALFIGTDGIILTLLNILCAFVMCFIAFFERAFVRAVISSAVFYASGMLLGGVMTAVYSRLGKYTGYVSLGGSIATVFGEIPLWIFCVLAAISAAVTFALGRLAKHRSSCETADVTLGFGESKSEITCLCDSANLLREPISSAPVIFISEREAGFIPKEIFDAMKSGGVTGDEKIMARIRFAPSSTVAGKGIVTCVKPDLCMISGESKTALLAVDFSGGDYGGHGGLVPKILL